MYWIGLLNLIKPDGYINTDTRRVCARVCVGRGGQGEGEHPAGCRAGCCQHTAGCRVDAAKLSGNDM